MVTKETKEILGRLRHIEYTRRREKLLNQRSLGIAPYLFLILLSVSNSLNFVIALLTGITAFEWAWAASYGFLITVMFIITIVIDTKKGRRAKAAIRNLDLTYAQDARKVQ